MFAGANVVDWRQRGEILRRALRQARSPRAISFCSAVSSRRATGEQAPTAILACRIRPSTTSSATATMTMEMTRYLRAPSFRKVERRVAGGAGQSTAASISSRARAVRRDPSKNFSSGSAGALARTKARVRRRAPAAAEPRRRRARRCRGFRRGWRGSGWTWRRLRAPPPAMPRRPEAGRTWRSRPRSWRRRSEGFGLRG